MGGSAWQGGGRGSSEKLFSSLLYVAGAADGARQDSGSDRRTKTSFVRVRAYVRTCIRACAGALLERGAEAR